MKGVVKRIVKTLLIFIISTIVIYLVFTISAFYIRCSEYQLFVDEWKIYEKLDANKIEEIGHRVGIYEQLLEEEIEKDVNEESQSFARFYNPLGLSVWSNIRLEVKDLVETYIWISILSGAAIAIAYAVITSKKMNNVLKIIIGYFGVMIIVPPIYKYTWTYRFWDIISTYIRDRETIYFYIGYTIIFVLIYIINYRIGLKMAKELNKTIEDSKK